MPKKKKKREGTYVYLWLIHVDIWQKTTKFCKAIILQFKKKTNKIRLRKKETMVYITDERNQSYK